MSFVNPRIVVEKQWIYVPKDDPSFDSVEQVQQAGIDLRVARISVPYPAQLPAPLQGAVTPQGPGSEIAVIGVKERRLPAYKEIDLEDRSDPFIVKRNSKQWYCLPKGQYILDFVEHIKVPLHCMALVVHRSTLNRSGTIVTGSVFDPGFSGQVGATMYVHGTLLIEPLARLAQIILFDGDSANAYTGAYKDKTHADTSGMRV